MATRPSLPPDDSRDRNADPDDRRGGRARIAPANEAMWPTTSSTECSSRGG